MRPQLRPAFPVLLALALAASPVARAQAPAHTFLSPSAHATGEFARDAAGVPDLNGDGRGDVLVGAEFENVGAVIRVGQIHVFSGATGGLLRTITSPNPQENGSFGVSVAAVPDADGDSRPDLLVGASREAGGAPNAGRAYLFSGASGALLRTLLSPAPVQNGNFGLSVGGVPDTNGDGRGDLLVGTSAGQAYLFSGASGTLLHTVAGRAVAGVPDANGDGRGDLLTGAVPQAQLFSGATGSLLHTFTSPNAEQFGQFGAEVAGVPDADGDGRGDVLVGANGETVNGVSGAGRAYLYSGATGARLHTLASPNAEQGGAFGRSVSAVPDADADGRPDLLVGAPREIRIGTSSTTAGRAYLFSGAAGTLLRTLTTPSADAFGGELGFAVAGVPDTDGDGRGDLFVGARLEDGGAANAGRAYLFSGVGVVANEAGRGAVRGFALAAPRPNPARQSAALTLTLAEAQTVRVEALDLLGRRVTLLHDGPLAAGAHPLAFATAGLPSGLYVVRATSAAGTVTRRVTVLR